MVRLLAQVVIALALPKMGSGLGSSIGASTGDGYGAWSCACMIPILGYCVQFFPR